MGNCLKTQLKEVVNNDGLMKLGYLYFRVNHANNSGRASIRVERASQVEIPLAIEGNGYFTDSSYQQNYGATTVCPYEGRVYVVATGPCKVRVDDNYEANYISAYNMYVQGNQMYSRTITQAFSSNVDGSMNKEGLLKNVWSFGCNDGTVDLSVLNGATRITNFTVGMNTKATGDISVLANCAQLSGTLNCYNATGINGSIGSLGNLTLVTVFGFDTSGVSGTIEGLAEGLWDNDKSSRTVECAAGLSNVTVHGTTIPTGYTYYMIFSAGGIIISHFSNGSNPIATYDGSNWTYPTQS